MGTRHAYRATVIRAKPSICGSALPRFLAPPHAIVSSTNRRWPRALCEGFAAARVTEVTARVGSQSYWAVTSSERPMADSLVRRSAAKGTAVTTQSMSNTSDPGPANSTAVPSGANLVIAAGRALRLVRVMLLACARSYEMASTYERLYRLSDVQLHRMGLHRSTLVRDAIAAVEARDKRGFSEFKI